MRKHRKQRPLAAAVSLITAVALAGCSSHAFNSPETCSLIGLGIGTASGIGWAASQSDDDTKDWALGVGVGAAGGALVGYAACALFGRDSGYAQARPAVRTAEVEPELSPEAAEAIYGLGESQACGNETRSAACLAGNAPVCTESSAIAAR